MAAEHHLEVAVDSQKITCVGWEAFVTHCAPFMNTDPPAPERPVSRYNLRTTNKSASAGPPTLNPFGTVPKANSENEMFVVITAALNKANVCPDYVFVSTPHLSQDSREPAVDCGLFPRQHAPAQRKARKSNPVRELEPTDWSWAELAVGCKIHPVDDDPFEDLETLERDKPKSIHRRGVLHDLLRPANAAFGLQHRTHLYAVLFLGGFFRILRIDRSGLFATERINYRQDGLKLAEFLWYFSRQTPALRGHDTTAVRIGPESDEAERMRALVRRVTHPEEDYALKLFKTLLDPDWPWWKLQVQDEANPRPTRYFLVGKPHFQDGDSTSNRATRRYVALEDVDSDDVKLVYLKDSWRVVCDDLRKEGDTLQHLREHDVPYVPTLVCHGDIPGQVSLSQRIWPEFHPRRNCPLLAHQHYRLVIEEVCKPLKEFTNRQQLPFVLSCAAVAHARAYSAGVKHCNMSDGNVHLYRQPGKAIWCGLLSDWQQSRRVEQNAEREITRVRTWQFSSVKALNYRFKKIDIRDEMESIFHVLLYMGLRFLPHNFDDATVLDYMYRYFSAYTPVCRGFMCGEEKRYAMNGLGIGLGQYEYTWPRPVGEHDTADTATATYDHPLNALSDTLFSWIKAYYLLPIEEDRLRLSLAFRNQRMRQREKKSLPSAQILHPDDFEIPDISPKRTKEEEERDEAEDEKREEASIRLEEKTVARYRVFANKLNSHNAVMRLFKAASSKFLWPKDDRCADRLAPKPPPRKTQPAAQDDAPSNGKKRDAAEAVDDPPSSPPDSKRRKTTSPPRGSLAIASVEASAVFTTTTILEPRQFRNLCRPFP